MTPWIALTSWSVFLTSYPVWGRFRPSAERRMLCFTFHGYSPSSVERVAKFTQAMSNGTLSEVYTLCNQGVGHPGTSVLNTGLLHPWENILCDEPRGVESCRNSYRDSGDPVQTRGSLSSNRCLRFGMPTTGRLKTDAADRLISVAISAHLGVNMLTFR